MALSGTCGDRIGQRPIGLAQRTKRARGLRRSRRGSGDGNQAPAPSRDELHRAALRQPQRPSSWLRPQMRSGGCKTNKRWRRSRWRRWLRLYHRHNAAPQSPRGLQTQSHAKAMLRTRRGRQSERERDLTSKLQVPAATRANASVPKSRDLGPFCAAMSSLAAREPLFIDRISSRLFYYKSMPLQY